MIVSTLFLILAVALGGGLAFAFSKMFRPLFNIILAFSGAFILGVSLLELLPAVYHSGLENVGIWIIVGFLVQLVLDYLSAGLEHGHMHPMSDVSSALVVKLLIGLCIHAFLEGLPLSGYHYHHHHHDPGAGSHFLWALVLHKAPAAFALGYVLLVSGVRRSIVILLLTAFALMTPMGQWIGHLLHFEGHIVSILTAMVIGSFLHISTTVLFETDRSAHQFSTRKLLAVILGFSIVYLTM